MLPDTIIISGAEHVGDFWRISVTDNGIGFQTGDVERIFQIFQRLHSPTEKYPGNGIGLAICKRIVEAHGGTLTAEVSPRRRFDLFVYLACESSSIHSLRSPEAP